MQHGLGYWLQYQCCWHVTGQQHANVMLRIIPAQMLPNFLSVVMLTGQAMTQLCRNSLMTFVTTQSASVESEYRRDNETLVLP